MEALVEEFKHLKIDLEEIKAATENFGDKNLIGSGGFGKVFKGLISHSKGKNVVAIKRLDPIYGQGNTEFWKEIMMLSRYTHQNLVSLVGFCDKGGEKILVYEFASRGSLDYHLSSTALTWTQRVKICLDIARGLHYLHDDKGTQHRILHRDIKSSNILLDDNWNAKISDLGLSKIGPANQQHTVVVSNVVGTLGYLDPLYMEMGILTKESDVYSFGVVLFEVLCGRLCFDSNNGRFLSLVRMWKQKYKQKKVDEIIFKYLKEQMDSASLEIFSDIGFQCLCKSREERPTMAHVVEKLETALEFREIYEEVDIQEMIKTVAPHLIYNSEEELNMLLSKGVLVNGGKTWFTLNMNAEHTELISIAECLITDVSNGYEYSSKYNSRFTVGSYLSDYKEFETHVRTQFLSPLITYTVNLVFKFKYKNMNNKHQYIALNYALKGGPKFSTSYLAYEREDGWFMTELYQFTSNRRMVDLHIHFFNCGNSIIVEGIEFQPQEKVEHEVLEDEKAVDMQSDSDAYWEQQLPNDYEDIIKWSKDGQKWTTKKELYSILRKGFLINNGQEWFFLDKNGKKCQMMLSARTTLVNDYSTWYSLPKSRSGGAVMISDWRFSIVSEIKSQVVSPQTTYACYLVYNLPLDDSRYEAPLQVKDKDFSSNDWSDSWYVYLVSPQTPVIVRGMVDENTHNPLNRPKVKGIPQQRTDGWMEVQVWEFQTGTTTKMIPMRLELKTPDGRLVNELVIQGFEYRSI